MPLRLNGSTSGYSQLDAPAIAGDQTFTLPGTGGTLDRLNRAGNILQVVNATYSTQASSVTSTFADTGLSASITPTASTSKILVMAHQSGCGKGERDTRVQLRLLRDSTVISLFEKWAAANGSTPDNFVGTCSICYLDSPATTSSVTYKTQFNSTLNLGTTYVNVDGSVSTITLLEVAA